MVQMKREDNWRGKIKGTEGMVTLRDQQEQEAVNIPGTEGTIENTVTGAQSWSRGERIVQRSYYHGEMEPSWEMWPWKETEIGKKYPDISLLPPSCLLLDLPVTDPNQRLPGKGARWGLGQGKFLIFLNLLHFDSCQCVTYLKITKRKNNLTDHLVVVISR